MQKYSPAYRRYTILKFLNSTKFVCFASRTVTTACTSSISFCFSSSSKFMYHLASLVFPALFWIITNLIILMLLARLLWPPFHLFQQYTSLYCWPQHSVNLILEEASD